MAGSVENAMAILFQKLNIGRYAIIVKMSISKEKKEALCRFQDMTCELCKKRFSLSDLHVHRINRGYMGGTYEDHRNLKVLCYKCHLLIHGREFT